ncbi:hypothetical protein CDL12_30289 [Handroanthus impetiginosus]|uniref:Non-specific serine/threonine protein kinase n=1 Tax=Handroanthus impetiginosus TaxID=429701 RepID=A0A2G9FWD6_9LAMI|nr:hypothetical protein CDL12_30289 [Handroanthus impetiginosus]
MAHVHFLTATVTLIFLSSSIVLSKGTPSISAAPALLPNAPFTELSPDIAPLLPTPGGSGQSPVGSSIPTIPSTRSPPNPDTTSSIIGPDTAVAPSGSLQDSSAVKGIKVGSFCGFLAYWLVLVISMI